MPNLPSVYKPVVKSPETGPFSAAALVGANTALVAWDVDASYDRKPLLGFAIRRTSYDLATGEISRCEWLEGQKRFKSDQDDLGLNVRSDKAPFQRFRWNDYTLTPGSAYLYEIFPMTKSPQGLTKGTPMTLTFVPAPPVADGLGVYFNRGVTSAQAYLERFHNEPPAKVPDDAAYRWLSRGLKESLLEFIAGARENDELHVAIYEFHDAVVADALKQALARKADVRIVYHAVDASDKTVRESVQVLTDAGLTGVATPRTNAAKISHNKFVVLKRGGKPVRVWTGSANFSEAGFYLQTNMGMVIDDAKTADAFEEYFKVLAGDPEPKPSAGGPGTKELVMGVMAAAEQAMQGNPWKLYFSPVRGKHIVDAAVSLVQNAKSAIFMSTPFAMDKAIKDAIAANDDRILEYGLANATAKKAIEGLNRRNTRFFTPTTLETYLGRKWDAKAFGKHKIHAKTIVTDPWGPSPSVLVGSANFSDESCRDNDENALLAVGNTRLAAIVAAEFIRMFDHYKSRGFINAFYSDTTAQARYLAEDGSWSDVSFRATSPSHKFRDREVFAGNL